MAQPAYTAALDGGHSSVGRAPGCGLGCHGFESRCSPHPFRMTEDRIAALILAGGEARRMGGGDKTLLEIGGRPMLAAVIDALAIRPMAISANGDPSRFAAFGLPVLSDGPFQGQGP